MTRTTLNITTTDRGAVTLGTSSIGGRDVRTVEENAEAEAVELERLRVEAARATEGWEELEGLEGRTLKYHVDARGRAFRRSLDDPFGGRGYVVDSFASRTPRYFTVSRLGELAFWELCFSGQPWATVTNQGAAGGTRRRKMKESK